MTKHTTHLIKLKLRKSNQNYKYIHKIHIESTFKKSNALTYPKTYKHAPPKINKPNHTHIHTYKERHNKTNTTRSQLIKTQNPNTNNKCTKVQKNKKTNTLETTQKLIISLKNKNIKTYLNIYKPLYTPLTKLTYKYRKKEDSKQKTRKPKTH